MICVEEGSSVGIESNPQPENPPACERFQEIDLWDAPPTDLADLNKYVYAASNPVDGSDPTGRFDLVETLTSFGVNAINFSLRAAPVAKVGFAIWDGITITRILYKGFTDGFNTVSASDWVQLGLATTGLVSVVPGTEFLAKAAVSAFLHLPIGPALRTFEGAKLAVGQLVKLEESAKPLVGVLGKSAGQFDVYQSGIPVIRYYRTGDTLFDAETLIHELAHYADWVLHGKPVGQAYKLFKDASFAFEQATDAYEKIAKLVMALAKA